MVLLVLDTETPPLSTTVMEDALVTDILRDWWREGGGGGAVSAEVEGNRVRITLSCSEGVRRCLEVSAVVVIKFCVFD